MNHLKTISALSLSAILLTACHKDRLEGSGNIVTQERSVPAFQNIHVKGPVRVNILLGATQQVTVRTDAVAVGKVLTTVNNNTLVVDLNGGHNYQHISFEVDVRLPIIHHLTHEGVSKISLSGFDGLDALVVDHDGVGDLELHGSATNLHVTHDGVGHVRAFGFVADTCQVAQSGVGNIHVTVNDRLHGYLSGVGNIYYQGSPQVSISDTGVGQVFHVD